MFKLLLSSAMMAPVLVFALPELVPGDADESLFHTPAIATATAAKADTCPAQTVEVAFHGSWLEAHSADAVHAALAPADGCAPRALRITTLVPESADADTLAEAGTRRVELAAFVAEAVGAQAARDLPVRADMQTRAAPSRADASGSIIRRDAFLHIERAPDGSAPTPEPGPAEAGPVMAFAGEADTALD